jgi:hypothetical protein
MLLDHPELPPFEPILKTITDIAFTSGIKALSSVGYKVDETKHNPQAMRRFIRGCHYGYDNAQQRTANVILGLDDRFRSVEEELKQKRRERGKDAVLAIISQLNVIKNRQLVLRRVLDTILYAILSGQSWILKRFLAQKEIIPIDPKVIARTVEIATEQNNTSRYRFNLVADLTTCAYYFDSG